MKNNRKYLPIGLLLILVIVAPIIFAMVTLLLRSMIALIGMIILIFLATAIIAWFGKIGRK